MEIRILNFIKSRTSPNLSQKDEYEKVFKMNTFYVTLIDPIYGDLRYLMTRNNRNYCIYTTFGSSDKFTLLNDLVSSIIYELVGFDTETGILNVDLLRELMKTLGIEPDHDPAFPAVKLALIDYLNINLKEKGDN